MYRIAQNLHRNDLRKDRVRGAHLATVDGDAIDTVSQNSAVDRMALGELGTAIGRLPDEQRMVLLMITVEGRSYQEAADVLGLSPGTVASRLSRARATLAALMDGGGA